MLVGKLPTQIKLKSTILASTLIFSLRLPFMSPFTWNNFEVEMGRKRNDTRRVSILAEFQVRGPGGAQVFVLRAEGRTCAQLSPVKNASRRQTTIFLVKFPTV